MNSTYAIGIDPGKKGAIAVYNLEINKIEYIYDTPVILSKKSAKNDSYDLLSMKNILTSLADLKGIKHVFIERSQAMPQQGVVSTFKIGYGYGLWEMGLVCSNLPYTTIRPADWTKVLFKGMPVVDDRKIRSRLFVSQNFPDAEVIPKNTRIRNALDGRTDAICIAYFGAHYLGKFLKFSNG